MLVNNLGPILAPVTGGTILAFTDWTGVFIVLACIGLILFLIVSAKLEETAPSEAHQAIRFRLSKFRLFIEKPSVSWLRVYTRLYYRGNLRLCIRHPVCLSKYIRCISPGFQYFIWHQRICLNARKPACRPVNRYHPGDDVFKNRLTRFQPGGSCTAHFGTVKSTIGRRRYPDFLFVSSLGIISTTSFSLAMDAQGHIAGSASALLGLLPFILGSLAAPLVGVAGENSAVPMGMVIFLQVFLPSFPISDWSENLHSGFRFLRVEEFDSPSLNFF